MALGGPRCLWPLGPNGHAGTGKARMGAAGVADARQSAARRRQPERQTGGADVAGGMGRWRTPRTTRSRGARRAGRGEHVLTAGAHVGGLACGDRERGVRQRRGEARSLTNVDRERGR